MSFVRSAIRWIARVGYLSPVADVYLGDDARQTKNGWLVDYFAHIGAALDCAIIGGEHILVVPG